jgi:hypothetical protein
VYVPPDADEPPPAPVDAELVEHAAAPAVSASAASPAPTARRSGGFLLGASSLFSAHSGRFLLGMPFLSLSSLSERDRFVVSANTGAVRIDATRG